jgi:hypothetical protein
MFGCSYIAGDSERREGREIWGVGAAMGDGERKRRNKVKYLWICEDLR